MSAIDEKAERRAARAQKRLRKARFNLLRAGSFPLISRKHRLMVLWSPKSACTTVYTWFANLMGNLDEMRAYNAWPHRHRIEIYRNLEQTEAAILDDFSDYFIVKVLRDPLHRAASGFRHALQFPIQDEAMSTWSDGRLDRSTGYSFSDFLGSLEWAGLDASNVHFRPQFHEIEDDFAPDLVINITRQNLMQELNKVEDRIGQQRTDFEAMGWLHSLEANRRPMQLTSGEVDDRTPLTTEHASGLLPWPTNDRLLTPSAIYRIKRLYAVDFERYAAHL
jgi:hypothetical protein